MNNGSSANSSKINGYKQVQTPNYTPEQAQLFQQLLSAIGGNAQQGLGNLGKLATGDQGMFEQMEAPAYTAFNKTLGQLGSRFSQYGAHDSSAFQNAVSGAGANLAENLQGKRSQMQMDALNQLLGFSSSLLNQKPYETSLLQEDQGLDWNNILSSSIQAIPSILKFL